MARIALLVGALALLAADVRAQPSLSPAERTVRARAHFDIGRSRFRAGEYAAAVEAFEKGYLLEPLPLFLYNIAQAARRAGQTQKALNFYRLYLDADPRAKEHAEVAGYIEELSRTVDEPAAVPAPPPVVALPPPIVPVSQPSASLLATTVVETTPRPPSRRGLWIGLAVGGAAVVVGVVLVSVLTTVPHAAPETELGNLRPFSP